MQETIMAYIELNEIAHSYLSKPENDADYALKRIHTVWEDGGAYALLGPSGCGKTTLLNIISGLLTPSQGRVLYDGKDVTALSPEKRNIAQVFQFPVLYDTMSVFDNLAFPLRNRGVPKNDMIRRVNEVAEILDLTSFLKKKAAGLTADAKQKVSLGRGLVRSDVAAILFDEPLTVIDPHLKWRLRRSLKQIHEQLKLTLIYVTHDQMEALTFAEKVVVMYDGDIVQIGTPQELFEYPEHRFVGYFIGSPGMNFLECTSDGDRVRVDNVGIKLDAPTAALANQAKGKLELGIRPMYLQLSAEPVKHGVKAQIKMVEDQGSCKIVSLSLAGKTVRARLPEGNPVPGGKVWRVFPPQKIRLFDDGKLIKKAG
jgi:glycerol transport system ATP-binding protein